MARHSTLQHPLVAETAWDPARPAVAIGNDLTMVHATSNVYLVSCDAGDVLINTGTADQAKGIRKKLEELLGRPLKVTTIVFTQSHPDHTGGWSEFFSEGVEMLVQAEFGRTNAERKLLAPFFSKRNARVLAALIPSGTSGEHWFKTPDPAPVTSFREQHDFSVGGRQFHLLALPSGETLDGLGVWLPTEKTLFIGNWAGALLGAIPNFHTARGDRDRSVTRWLEDCKKLLGLHAAVLVTGHGMPLVGATTVAGHFGRLHDTVRFLHDETVKGMNEGRSLAELRSSITLPAELSTQPGRSPVDWVVRSIWEEYAGWFHQDLTSELYGLNPTEIWPDLAAMAGGAIALADRAKAHLAQCEGVKALHFIEIALAAEPANPEIRSAAAAIYELLIDQTEGRDFDLIGWLEGQIVELRGRP